MALQLSYEVADSTKTGPAAMILSYYQSFIPTTTFTLDNIKLNIDSNAGTAISFIYIYNADAEGKPTGSPLSGSHLAVLWDTYTGWQGDWEGPSVNLTKDNRYCIRVGGSGVSGAYELDFDSADGYADGVCWYWNGSSYTNQNGALNFRLYGTELAAPSKATNPAPSDANSDVTLDQATITWEDGGGADTFDVYYGDTSGSLVKISSAQVGASFTVTGITNGSPYGYLVVRYWRIDSTNTYGTTTGDEWFFSTIRLDPPKVTYWYSTTGQYYQLLIQADGSYGDHPADGGVENTDYVYLAAGYEPNFVKTTRRLVAIAENRVWIEDI